MNTVAPKIRALFAWVSMALALLYTPGCQQRCQPPATQRIKNLSETGWRLVETTDQAVKGLDNYNFLIYTFARNFSGDVKQVRFNDQFETPFKTFNWNIVNGQLVIRYASIAPPSTTGTQGSGSPSTQRNASDAYYNYSINHELEMIDGRGNYYRFVPFQGVVDPDTNCKF